MFTLMDKLFLSVVITLFTLEHICICDENILKQDNIFTVILQQKSGTVSILNRNTSSVTVVSDLGSKFYLICQSSCPVQWRLEKYRFTEFPDAIKDSIRFKTSRIVADFHNNSTYKFSSEIHFVGSSNKVTGNYFCSCTDTHTTSWTPIGVQNTSVYVYRFWEASSGSYLLQAGEDQKVYRQLSSPWVKIFCGVSNPNQTVYLFKMSAGNDQKTPVLLPPNNISMIQDIDGFSINIENVESPFGKYLCASKPQLSSRDSSGLGYPVAKIEIFDKFSTNPRKIFLTSSTGVSEQSENIMFFNPKNNEIACCSQNEEQEAEQLGYYCETPQECAFFLNRVRGHFKNANQENNTCSSYAAGKQQVNGGAVVRCLVVDKKTDADLTEVYAEMFYSLNSDQYFNVQDAKMSSLIQITFHTIDEDRKRVRYLGEKLSFHCKRPSYPFSEGTVWGLKKSDGSVVIVNKSSKNTCMNYKYATFYSASTVFYFELALGSVNRNSSSDYVVEDVDKMQNNDTLISIRIYNENVTSVLCHLPFWNSYEWGVAQLSVNLSKSEPPKIEGEKEVVLQFYSGDKFVRASCKAHGIPPPRLVWKKNSESLDLDGLVESHEESNGEYVTNIFNIRLADMDDELDTYECCAINPIGEDRQRFRAKLKESKTGTIVGSIVGVLSVGIVVSILLRKIVVQKKELKYLSKAEIEEFELGKPEVLANWSGDINACTHLLPYNNSYEISRGTLFIDEKNILGQGTYGMVMKGFIKLGTSGQQVVAVKTVKPNQEMMHFKILLSELKIMAFIGSHQYIVSLVGAYSRNIRNRELLVAIEFCENGSLQDYLRKFRTTYEDLFNMHVDTACEFYVNGDVIRKHEEHLDTKQLVSWSLEIASGMEFLGSKKVIHGDLATRNVLITAQRTAKIGDFGLSKHLFEYSTYVKKTPVLLPWKWMALESLVDMEFSVHSDMWAFGITLWEIFTLAQTPYPGVPWDSDFLEKLRGNYRLPKPKYSSSQIYELMLNCWNHQPHDRPKFTDVKTQFMEILSSVNINAKR